MGVTVRWEDETRRILRYRFDGMWNWDEYYSALIQGRRMMSEVQHRVCILNDMQNTSFVPDSFLIRARAVMETRPANAGLGVFISSDRFFQSMHQVFARLYPDLAQLYPLVHDEAAALAIVREWLQRNEYSQSS